MSHPKVACGKAWRSAAAAGKVWMMSPMALRRTMSRLSNRGVVAEREKELVILLCLRRAVPAAIRASSRFLGPQPRAGAYDFGGRVIFRITHDHDSASAGFNLVALGDAFHRVVGALGMKIGTDFANEGAHVRFRKDDNG